MKEEFVTYTQSLALKELGFDEPCMFVHDTWGNTKNWTEDGEGEHRNSDKNASIYYSAPLKQQVFRWFREKHKLHSWVQPMYEDQNFFVFVLARPNDFMIPKDIIWEGDEYLNHEEAENACIDMLIEIIKNKKDEKDNTDNNNNNNRLHL